MSISHLLKSQEPGGAFFSSEGQPLNLNNVSGIAYITDLANALVTTINSVGTYEVLVIPNGLNVSSHKNVTIASDGTVTYTGENRARLHISATLYIGTAKKWKAAISRNGAILTSSENISQSAGSLNLNLFPIIVNTGDVLRLNVANLVDTVNLTCEQVSWHIQ